MQRPPEQLPPPQSEDVLHAPHWPLEQLPWPWQSLLVEHPPQRLFEQLPKPLQSELVLQLPHLPFEQLPKPLQSDDVLHSGSATGAKMPAGDSAVTVAARCEVAAANAGTGSAVTVGS